MRKWIFLCFLFIWAFEANAFQVLAEGTAAYFQPLHGRFEKIYGGTPIYGGELSFPIRWGRQKFGPWIGASFLKKTGKSYGNSGEHYSTQVKFLPIDFGLKLFIPVKRVDFYFGMGGRYSFLTTHDHYEFGKNPVHQNRLGWIAKTGVLFNLFHKFFLDIFVNYSYNRFSATHCPGLVPVRVHLNAVSGGMGLGYRFGGL